jgi:peptidoglycan/LPS O-acetylase OafA/YrhL
VAIVVVVPCLRLLSPDPSRDLLLTWMRCDGLALGALIATWLHIVKPDRRRALPAIAGLVACAIAVRALEWLLGAQHISRALRPSEADLVFGAAILAAYAFRGSRVTAFLRSRAASFVAGTSYCAYVIHLSIFNAVDALGWTASSSILLSGCLRLGWSVPIIFALAALSKRFLEDPFLRLRAKLAPRLSA